MITAHLKKSVKTPLGVAIDARVEIDADEDEMLYEFTTITASVAEILIKDAKRERKDVLDTLAMFAAMGASKGIARAMGEEEWKE